MKQTVFEYKDSGGAILGTITRFDADDGTKTFRASKGFPNPRPLYGLDLLAERPNAPVLVFEGEGKTELARKIFRDFVCVTTPFGALSAAKADLKSLENRTVIIWPDNNKPGFKYALDLAARLTQARVVDTTGLPEDWDIADQLPAGMTFMDLRSRLAGAARPTAPKAKKQSKKKDDLRKSAEDAKRARDALLAKVHALRAKTVANGCTKAEAEASANKAKELMDEHNISDEELEFGVSDVEEDDFGTEDALRESAAGIIASRNVLENFAAAWRTMIAGEERNAKLLYLVATSRLFDRPMHAAIKGPSAAGKSEIRKRVLEFFPRESILAFTMLSEKALLYFERDFTHLILSMGEAAGTEEQQIQDYLLRELMSDGKLRYPVTIKTNHGLATHIIEKNGPVCFLVTTTKHALHQENETRMLSIEVDDSADQTSAVLLKIAETEGLNNKIRPEQYIQWQNFQRWLAKGNCRVVVPYASALAKLVQPKSVRLRRDFTQMLMAIKAHALLHREHRFTNDEGEITADMSDFAVVRELMSDLMADASEVKVKATVVETVEAVRTLQAKVGSEGVTAQAVGKQMKLDKSSARRRLHGAMDAGLIKNMETRRFQPGLYRTVDVDVDTQELLPTVEEVIDRWCKDHEDAA